MGSIYQPTLKSGKPSSIWWARYYINGRKVRESTGTEDKRAARDFLKGREGSVVKGEPILPRADRVTYDELLEDLLRHYANHKPQALKGSARRLRYLTPFFTRQKAITLTPARIAQYVEARRTMTPAPAPATINRELSVLSRMLTLGHAHDKVARVRTIGKLEEAAPRAGFFEDHQYQAVRRHLPEDLQLATTIMYTFGWRVSEVLSREWRHVDLHAGTLRLDPGQSKNDDGRVVYLGDDLIALLTAQRGRVDALQRQLERIIPCVFPHLTGGRRYRPGDRRRDFRKAWAAACKAAGVAGRLRHDFRRTAVRNMERLSVPRSVAMKITGHRSETVYRRYAIVNDADLQEATRRLTGTFSGHVRPENPETRSVKPQLSVVPARESVAG